MDENLLIGLLVLVFWLEVAIEDLLVVEVLKGQDHAAGIEPRRQFRLCICMCV